MKNTHPDIKAKGKPEWTSLFDHLQHVVLATEMAARHTGFDLQIARLGAILHDIGKAHPVFQARLHGVKSKQTFRHELASLFFLPLVPQAWQASIIEMIVAHHKSMIHDRKEKGLLDLIEYEGEVMAYHLGDWQQWSPAAMEILQSFGVQTRPISQNEAEASFEQVINYCETLYQSRGYSEWRGLLMGADHFASAMVGKTAKKLQNLYQVPKLDFYQRQHPFYPLSYYEADSPKPHSLVVASTGAGKTDFLLRRTQGRVFYTLPFQASINAMYQRLKLELSADNSDLNIKLLHAASALIESEDQSREEIILQRHMGSSVKVLTPYQLAGIALGSKGFEALIVDLRGCDVILDEVHTYSGIAQALVLKIISVLVKIGCRLHIGTATMPTFLYEAIKAKLGSEQVLEVKLTEAELDTYNRHRTFKIEHWEIAWPLIEEAIVRGEKILIVCNRIQNAQDTFREMQHRFPKVDKLLLHSRFRRKDRKAKEQLLMGIDATGKTIGRFNTASGACIVVSTQVVEVSIDISFDLMITECAPLDAMIQRFGRINRKRNVTTVGLTKPVYVLAPPDDEKMAKPYELDVLQRSYLTLPHDDVLTEKSLQAKIDAVFPTLDVLKIEEASAFKADGSWSIPPLTNGSGWLVELLGIDTVACILTADVATYHTGKYKERMALEMSARYFIVKEQPRLEVGNMPYVLPDQIYDLELGLDLPALRTLDFDTKQQII